MFKNIDCDSEKQHEVFIAEIKNIDNISIFDTNFFFKDTYFE